MKLPKPNEKQLGEKVLDAIAIGCAIFLVIRIVLSLLGIWRFGL